MRMTSQRKQFLVGATAIIAVATILSFVEVQSDPGNPNGKGKSQPFIPRCTACTDPCVPPTSETEVGTCAEDKHGNGAFESTRACCCCGNGNEDNFFKGFGK